MEAETGHVGEKTGRTDEVETGVNTGREEREENGVREEVTVGVEEVVLHEEAAVSIEVGDQVFLDFIFISYFPICVPSLSCIDQSKKSIF